MDRIKLNLVINNLRIKFQTLLTNKKKLTILFFGLFAIVVAIITLSGELKKEETGSLAPTPKSETPSATDENNISDNSTTKTVDENTHKYENSLLGFSFEYPSGVGFVGENGVGSPKASTVYVSIDNLNNPNTKNLSAFNRDKQMLESGDFGLEVEKVPHFRIGVIKVNNISLKIFTILENEDCGGIALNRNLVFYRFDRRISITLKGPRTRLIKEYPNYFVRDGRCGNNDSWSAIGAETFLSSIANKTAPDYALKWNSDFSNLVSTLRITDPTDKALFSGSVSGRWQGDSMVVSLVANNKLGHVTEMKLWYGDNETGDWESYTPFKMVPSKDKIRVKFKDQYGNVSQVFSTNVEFK